jgi:hypothetical protein
MDDENDEHFDNDFDEIMDFMTSSDVDPPEHLKEARIDLKQMKHLIFHYEITEKIGILMGVVNQHMPCSCEDNTCKTCKVYGDILDAIPCPYENDEDKDDEDDDVNPFNYDEI